MRARRALPPPPLLSLNPSKLTRALPLAPSSAPLPPSAAAPKALSFHRVAFKDRLTEIEFNVAVLDRLRLYRPKTRREQRAADGVSSSGYATPKSAFGKVFNGSGAAGEKKRGTPSFGFSTSRNGSGSSSAAAAKFAADRDAAAASDARFDITRPSSTAGVDDDDDDDDVDHTYPPRADPADEEKKAGFARFAGNVGKGVRKVALHDARNVKGKQGKADDADLTSNLNSAKVAKVRRAPSPSSFSSLPLLPILARHDSSRWPSLTAFAPPALRPPAEPRPDDLQGLPAPQAGLPPARGLLRRVRHGLGRRGRVQGV